MDPHYVKHQGTSNEESIGATAPPHTGMAFIAYIYHCTFRRKVHMTLSQLNDTNAVQKWSFSKCGFSTGLVSKINGKHVHGNIIVLFIQKIARGASCRPPGGPRVAPQNVRFKICPVFLLNELKTIYFSFKIYF